MLTQFSTAKVLEHTQPYLTQQAAYSGPQAYQSFMSPYQQDVIDATLSEFDKQTAAGLTGIGQKQQCLVI